MTTQASFESYPPLCEPQFSHTVVFIRSGLNIRVDYQYGIDLSNLTIHFIRPRNDQLTSWLDWPTRRLDETTKRRPLRTLRECSCPLSYRKTEGDWGILSFSDTSLSHSCFRLRKGQWRCSTVKRVLEAILQVRVSSCLAPVVNLFPQKLMRKQIPVHVISDICRINGVTKRRQTRFRARTTKHVAKYGFPLRHANTHGNDEDMNVFDYFDDVPDAFRLLEFKIRDLT